MPARTNQYRLSTKGTTIESQLTEPTIVRVSVDNVVSLRLRGGGSASEIEVGSDSSCDEDETELEEVDEATQAMNEIEEQNRLLQEELGCDQLF